jgi:hypothetical protein
MNLSGMSEGHGKYIGKSKSAFTVNDNTPQ